MKLQIVTSAIAASTMTVMVGALWLPASATETTFICDRSNEIPLTIARTPEGDIPLIRWEKNQFTAPDYDPQVQCQEASKKFQAAYRNGRTNYLTIALMGGQPVVCIAGTNNNSCVGLLFPINPRSSSERNSQVLMNIPIALSRASSISSPPAAINLNVFIDRASLVTTPTNNSGVQPKNTFPLLNQPASPSNVPLW